MNFSVSNCTQLFFNPLSLRLNFQISITLYGIDVDRVDSFSEFMKVLAKRPDRVPGSAFDSNHSNSVSRFPVLFPTKQQQQRSIKFFDFYLGFQDSWNVCADDRSYPVPRYQISIYGTFQFFSFCLACATGTGSVVLILWC